MADAPTGNTANGDTREVDVAIIGGGIAGLYCALKYKGTGFQTLCIYEAYSKLGGRICTEHFGSGSKVEFDAEFGPMRIEPEHQELLKALLDDLGIAEKQQAPCETQADKEVANVKASTDSEEVPDTPAAYLVDFPPYASPVDLHEPRYDLSGEERDQKTALDLLNSLLSEYSAGWPLRSLRRQCLLTRLRRTKRQIGCPRRKLTRMGKRNYKEQLSNSASKEGGGR